MPYPRILDLNALLQHRSVFLFGPRQTGKTTFLRTAFPQAHFVDLLDAVTFRELSTRPELLGQSLSSTDKWVVIDEIQKLPSLLDEVQRLIERHKSLRFILTGGSARKMKRGSANLLGGRALTCRMHALVSPEVNFQNLEQRVRIGSLPAVLDSAIPFEDLSAYIGTYLQEEIQAEGLTRNIENFSRFLEVAALTNTELINFTSVGSDAGVSPRTVQNFYQILEDTLVGYLLPPFQKTKKRKAVSMAKFYFFDVGVANTLAGREALPPRTPEYGKALEHLLFCELRAYLDYTRSRLPLTFWRSKNQDEVDFVVGQDMAIEVKAKTRVSEQDLRGLRRLGEEIKFKRRLVICQEPWKRRTEDGIELLGVEEFLRELWAGR